MAVINMKSIYESLEFNEVLLEIKEYAKTSVGKEYVANASIFSNEDDLKNELDILNEMLSLVLRFNELPIDSSSDLLSVINHALKTGLLTVYDLEHVANDVLITSRILNRFNAIEEEYPLLRKKMNEFYELGHIEKLIHSVVSPSLSIYDNASNELARIRRALFSLESDLSLKAKSLVKTYQSYLSDNTITLRNGHYVLPVKNTFKFKVDGIIHDTSDSGNTVFIEPSVIVELNNKIASLRIEEADEISRILRNITKEVIKEKDHIIANNQTLGYIDFLNAKAKYALNNNGVVANISSERVLSIKEGRHPLINKDEVVPNDFYLDNDKHMIIISGPNAGGKSVALKTVGLLVTMHQSGFPILALEGAAIPFFKRIYVDIGDQQSLNDSLSTFSAHMQNIIECTKKMGSKDLVIIDELGTGTDPQEGEALAKSILDFLHFKHAYALISSHFMGVKTYALDKDYVNNASMIFDESNFLPTYKLRLGVPGKSYGMEVALRLGMDKAIIDKAKKYLKEDNSNLFSTSLSKLDEIVNKYETLTKTNKELSESLKKKEAKLNDETRIFEERKAKLMQSVNEEKEEILEEAKESIDEILHNLNKKDLKMHEVIEAKAKIDALEDKEVRHISNEKFKLDDYVSLADMNLTGVIIRINNDKITVQTNIGKLVVDKNDLAKISRPVEKKKVTMTNVDRAIVSRSVPLELNLIGKHVDEAMDELEKYLDDVVIKGYSTVRIIHGSGTGTLRKAVHTYLDKQKFVKSYRLGGMGEGGVGATVVTLK